MSNHLGPAVTAFVDGELDHGRREEVLTHLTHCYGCRAEVEALRSLKAALRGSAQGIEAPAVPLDLASRLMSAMAQAPEPEPQPLLVRIPLGHLRSAPHRTAVRKAAMSGALVALGLGGALSLAGPPPRGPQAPVDPTNAGFVRDHGATSNELPFTQLDVVSVSSVTATSSPAP